MKQWERCSGRLVCPVCGDALMVAGRSLRCPAGHAFDVARQGYVDLLPAGHGRSKLLGDSREMVRARHRFLERGHYRAISDAIIRSARGVLAGSVDGNGTGPVILESGCGDGYYVARLAGEAGLLRGRTVSGGMVDGPEEDAACVLGLDVSREALRVAARSHPGVGFFINDVKHRICLADGSVDVLLDAFAPRNPAEFARVLRPGGVLLVVVPLDAHLAELRAAVPLLGIQPDKRGRVEDQLGDGFELTAVERVEERVALTADDVLDLLRMTPTYWHTDEAARVDAAAELDGGEVTIGVEVLSFRPTGRP